MIEIQVNPPLEVWNELARGRAFFPVSDGIWREIYADAMGLRAHHLLLREDGRPLALCPLVALARLEPFVPASLIASPYVPAAGLILLAPERLDAVIRALTDYARQLGVRWVELRQAQALAVDAPVDRSHLDMVIRLPARLSDFERRVAPRVRQARAAARAGVQLRAASGPALVDPVYDIFSARMRELIFPTYPRRYFAEIAARAPGATLWLAGLPGREAAVGAITVREGDDLAILYSADRVTQRPSQASALLHLELIRAAHRGGVARVHFGRCQKTTGMYQFKRQWGAQEHPLYYYRLPARPSRPIADVARVRDSSLYRALGVLWPRVPLALTRRVGPHVIRRLPQA
jgi:serine/alanine adding enzyme